jgi:hypothetical protein
LLHIFSDVISIPKTNENYRLLYDTKGRFRLHAIKDEDAKVGAIPFSRFFIFPVLRDLVGIKNTVFS